MNQNYDPVIQMMKVLDSEDRTDPVCELSKYTILFWNVRKSRNTGNTDTQVLFLWHAFEKYTCLMTWYTRHFIWLSKYVAVTIYVFRISCMYLALGVVLILREYLTTWWLCGTMQRDSIRTALSIRLFKHEQNVSGNSGYLVFATAELIFT